MSYNPLHFSFKQKELNSMSKEKRLANIEAFSNLERKPPLKFGEVERYLSIAKTENGEEIFIRYPGKESAREKNCRPLDFRPVLKKADGTWMNNLSFGDIWDDITNLHNKDPQTLSELAAQFFRMAYMVEHVKVTEDLYFYDENVTSGEIVNSGRIMFTHYKLMLPLMNMQRLMPKIGLIRDVSLEAYLIYNDLLVQNEDCKYYYRNQVETPEKEWNPKNGRLNTILSHLSVIEYLQGRITFSQITMRFQRGMGVAPITSAAEIELVTNGLIVKE